VAPRSLKVHGKNLPFGGVCSGVCSGACNGVCSGACSGLHASVIGNARHEDRKPPE